MQAPLCEVAVADLGSQGLGLRELIDGSPVHQGPKGMKWVDAARWPRHRRSRPHWAARLEGAHRSRP